MTEEKRNVQHARWSRYLKWAVALGMLTILGSCVMEIDDVGGGHDANQKMAGIFFLHLFLVVPCLFGLSIYLQLKLEKHFLAGEDIERMNEAHMKYARKELKRLLGPLHSRVSAFFENKD